ncbi:unnamed protein product [Urochloa humidicola]
MRGISKIAFVLACVWMLLGTASPAKIHGNPANDLVALVNGKRAASKLPALRNSAGLGCMALQYISDCMAMSGGAAACSGDNTVACEPPEAHITEVYAANCGVELPTVDVVSSRLIGCHRERSSPEDALQAVLASGAAGSGNTTSSFSKANANANASSAAAAALKVIMGKEHTQVGAGFDRAHRHGPFFWCLLFSSGSANSTFLLEAGGKGIHQTHGCFSAPDRASCNAAARPRPRPCLAVGAAAFLLLLLFHCNVM